MANALAWLPGGKSADHRITSGVGDVRERTIEVGDTVIAVNNIGTIVMLEEKRNYGLLILGAVLFLFGLMSLENEMLQGVAAILVGGALAAYNLLRPLDKGLSIGTCDGRLTLIISTNERFVTEFLDFLRRKVDSQSVDMRATFDIRNAQINTSGGGVVIGDNGVAGGAGGHVRAGY